MSQNLLVVPPGRATGCLPRRSAPGEWFPLLADKMDIIDPSEWLDWIGGIELSPHVPVVLDQDGVGSCATESTTAAVMLARVLRGEPHVMLNPWFIYHTTSGGSDSGSSIDENLAFANEFGIAPESVWPRSNGWRTNPSEEAYAAAKEFRILEAYDITTTAEIGTALLRGFPVVFGWQGHSVLFTELLSLTRAKYLNSWAQSWGDDGFGELELSAVNFRYGAFAVRVAD